ncbi:tyrosine--tRNA ligase [Pseudomonas sp. GD03944]|uniref:tyrosine--tRNA ligase n=1 Tax=Pseudomonas sp. GD03944 TaxID=2975409 RepID=UPI00244CF3DC|nr:tyrosine--tRNA ligase [Pseudomonas sp. GD03944]MDH1263146.1 tyrosine--tRNA ligase [Pseudomonas sp. GD03944]
MPATSPDLLDQLDARGFVHQCTDLDGLRQTLSQGPITFYLGFDATADSLHVGHLQALMLMRHLQRAGHKPILLIGGATTRIGDPSFRDSSRPVLTEAQIQHNIAGITGCFARYIHMGDGPSDGLVVDNADWLDGVGYLQFLNEVGRHFSINRLLTFDAVRNRLDREHSLSFQEFGYTLLQAHDFTELARRHNCTLQLGGADQWANIINGVELSRRQGGKPLFGLTMPLLTTRDGRKMGKSAQGAVWLNGDKLSPYDFWQFWRNCDDADVGRFLALFSELPLDEVARLAALQGAALNQAKIVLANAATALAHGEDAAQAAARAAAELFAGKGDDAELPALEIDPERLGHGLSLMTVLLEAGLQPSRGAVRRLVEGGGLRLNGETLSDADLPLQAEHLGARVSLGKKRHFQLQAHSGAHARMSTGAE